MSRRPTKILKELAAEPDPQFFKALSEPVRLDIFKLLIVRGTMDVDSIAAEFPQHRSVISRHPHVLHGAGVLSFTREGRHVRYGVDSRFMLGKLERILTKMREVMAACCPPSSARHSSSRLSVHTSPPREVPDRTNP